MSKIPKIYQGKHEPQTKTGNAAFNIKLLS